MTYKKKLIEVALPLDAINREAAREKSIRHGHPFSIHHWWARRPLVSARAMLWAAVVDDPSAHPELFPSEEDQERERRRLFQLLAKLADWDHSNDEQTLEQARDLIRASSSKLPTVVDPFCGFGTISIEAQRLGLETAASDLNPVAVLVAKSTVEVAPRFAGMPAVNPHAEASSGLQTWERSQGLAADVEFYGRLLRARAQEQVGHLFPKVDVPARLGGGEATPIAWLWARTVQSPDPAWGGHVPLVKSWVLQKSKSGSPKVWIRPVVDPDRQTVIYDVVTKGSVPEATIKRAKGICIATGTPIQDGYIKAEGRAGRIETQLMAVAVEGERGRVYVSAAEAGDPPNPDPPIDIPSLTLSTHSQYMGPPLYGYATTTDLFTTRQLYTLRAFVGLLSDIRREIQSDAMQAGLLDDDVPLREGGTGALAYSEAVAMYLAFAIDKLADLGNAFCAWEPIAQCPRHLFGRQAMPMIWDFAEANPFSESSGSWQVIVDGIVRAIRSIGFVDARARGVVEQIDATALLQQHPEGSVLICTDPPYYDNVPYADLSDFFYVWLRPALRDFWPDELSTLAVPKSEELVADVRRHGGKEKADAFFEEGMSRFFEVARKAQDPDYPLVVYYAFRQSEKLEEGVLSTGWQTFLKGILDAGWAVVATWPVRTETAGRLRAQGSNALASSIVLACRPRAVDAVLATRSELLTALRTELPGAIKLLQAESILPVDLAQSAIGPGMAIFSRFAKVVEADGSPMTVRQALALINEVLQEVLSEEETEFDPDSRWALTWYEENGFAAGPYGRAETLATAKDTSVEGVIHAGVATSRDGKVRLVSPSELSDEWDPTVDHRPTVWELTHHLIRRLESSESYAAELLRRVGGGYGDRARQLAYLLFDIAERNGRAQEAVAYNSLIQAWPDLTRLAASASAPVQQTLGE